MVPAQVTTETPDIVYGRLLESAHLTGYAGDRMCAELDWLLDGDRWRQVGPGYAHINDFLATVNLAAVDMSSVRRQSIIRKLDELGATQRPMVRALGVGKGTIHRALHLDGAPDGAPGDGPAVADLDGHSGNAPDGAPEKRRRQAEEMTERIRAGLHRVNLDIVTELLGGAAPAAVAGRIAAEEREFTRKHGGEDWAETAREVLFGARIDGALAWPHAGAVRRRHRQHGRRAVSDPGRAAQRGRGAAVTSPFDGMFAGLFSDMFPGAGSYPEPPDSLVLRILGLAGRPASQDAVKSAFRARLPLVHPDVSAYAAVPWLQSAADAAAIDRPEVAELVWARDVLLRKIPPAVTANNGPRGGLFSHNAGPYFCPDCKRPITGAGGLPASHHRGWRNHCAPCGHKGVLREARDRRRRRRADRACAACGQTFTPARSDGRYCSSACRQKAYRQRRQAA